MHRQERFSADPGGKVFTYDAKIDRVVDGDTLWCWLTESHDFGFETVLTVDKHTDLRLFGLDAKPSDTEEGKQATLYLQQLTDKDAGPLVVQTIKDKKEKYGRYLAILWVGDSEKSVNQLLVEGGLAVPWNGKGPHPV